MMDSRKLRQFTLQDFAGLSDGLETGKTDAVYAAITWANHQPLTYDHIEQPAPTTGLFEPSSALVIGGPSGMVKTCLAALPDVQAVCAAGTHWGTPHLGYSVGTAGDARLG